MLPGGRSISTMPKVTMSSDALRTLPVMVMSPKPTLFSIVTAAVIASMSPEIVMPGQFLSPSPEPLTQLFLISRLAGDLGRRRSE